MDIISWSRPGFEFSSFFSKWLNPGSDAQLGTGEDGGREKETESGCGKGEKATELGNERLLFHSESTSEKLLSHLRRFPPPKTVLVSSDTVPILLANASKYYIFCLVYKPIRWRGKAAMELNSHDSLRERSNNLNNFMAYATL